MTQAKPEAQANAAARMFTVLLVDDHPIVRFGLRQLIESEPDLRVCGETDNAGDALSMIEKLRPDLAVVDLSLEVGNGIELIKQIRARGKTPKVLVVSMRDEATYAERAIRAGATGYVNKADATDDLIAAVRQVLADHIHLSSKLTGDMLGRAMGRPHEETTPEASLSVLTDRELEIFELIGRGFTSRQVADNLFLSIKTVDTYRRHIKEKLKIESNTEMTVFAANWKQDQQ